jgi:hypothetical protein
VALTDEQRAMLQLLLEGGQGYEDIGSLLGIAPDEVRSRARAALGEIGGADPDAQVGLSDYVLGQADPIGRADAVRQLQSDPEANALAQRLVQNLRLLAPKAQLPEIPEAKGGRRAAAPPPPPPPAAPTQPAPPPAHPAPPAATVPQGPGFASRAAGFFSGIGRLSPPYLAAAGFLAVLVVAAIVYFATSGGGGGGGSDCAGVNTAAAQQAGVPTMKLSATGSSTNADCPPSGLITLGSSQQSQKAQNQSPTFVLQANAVHLPPTGSNERYLLWLFKSDSQSVPLGQEQVGSSGNLNGAVPVPAQELVLFPAFQTIRLARVTSAQAQQVQNSLQSQGKKPSLLVPFVGQTVIQGNVADLGIQQLLQQAQAQAQGGSSGGGTSTTPTTPGTQG